MNKPKVVAIVGPTASGKTGLSIELAKRFNGEVISADSRQVYVGLDIGSGKVAQEEMEGIPHHLLDVVEPTTVYSGADFKRDATAALEDILKRGRCPIVVGGTFFYLDLLRDKVQAAPVPPDEALRAELEQLSTEELFEKLTQADPRRAADIDEYNRHRLIRALEIVEALGHVPYTTQTTSPYEWLVVGIDIDKEQLHQNIHNRLIARIEAGMIREVQTLHRDGLSFARLESFGLEYRYVARYLNGAIDYDTLLTELETKIRQFAKRQMTWLKRDNEIEWYTPENRAAILNHVEHFLAS